MDGYSALHIAADVGDAQAIRILVEFGADVNISDCVVCCARSYKVGVAQLINIRSTEKRHSYSPQERDTTRLLSA